MAQTSHTNPGPHGSNPPAEHAGAHCPVEKMQTSAGPQLFTVQPPGPVELDVTDTEELLEVSEVDALEEPPAPSTTTFPPHADTSSARIPS